MLTRFGRLASDSACYCATDDSTCRDRATSAYAPMIAARMGPNRGRGSAMRVHDDVSGRSTIRQWTWASSSRRCIAQMR